jgi:hypothetical protein
VSHRVKGGAGVEWGAVHAVTCWQRTIGRTPLESMLDREKRASVASQSNTCKSRSALVT